MILFAGTNNCITIMKSYNYRLCLIIIMKMDIFQVNLEFYFFILKAFCTFLLTQCTVGLHIARSTLSEIHSLKFLKGF